LRRLATIAADLLFTCPLIGRTNSSLRIIKNPNDPFAGSLCTPD
jgi:hypothetical protein